jgi:hypothetical protein
VKIFIAFYRQLLRLWPAEFRERHGDDALAMAAARVRQERGLRQIRRAGRELVDVILCIGRIRRSAFDSRSVQRSGGAMTGSLIGDVRYACRSLARSPGFVGTAAALLTISLAVAIIVTVILNAYLLRGLPFPAGDRLFNVRYGDPTTPFVRGLETLDWQSLDDVVEHPIAWDLDLFNLRGAPYPEAAQGSWVTPGYMEAFGVRPALGRTFSAGDFSNGAPAVAIISHRLWQTRFGGDRSALGRQFDAYVSDRPDEPQTFTIVGVLAAEHWHLNASTEVLAPLRVRSYPYMVRLRDGVPAQSAAVRIEALIRRGTANVAPNWSVTLDSAHDAYVIRIRPLLTSLAIATALVVLIAGANVAVMFTLRAAHRRRDVAVRRALGASTARVLRTLAAEAAVVGAVSTIAAVAMAQTILTIAGPALERHLGRPVPGRGHCRGAAHHRVVRDRSRLDGDAIAGGVRGRQRPERRDRRAASATDSCRDDRGGDRGVAGTARGGDAHGPERDSHSSRRYGYPARRSSRRHAEFESTTLRRCAESARRLRTACQ